MTHSDVIDKLTRECCLAVGDFSYFSTVKIYIQQALVIGIDHFTVDMEEIIVMDPNGNELHNFKSITEASKNIGVRQSDISAVLIGQQQTAGGFKFIKRKDKRMIKI
jgi:hypothetical protein